MNHKVLLADDSLTIQKVIKITLANQPYDIVECASDEELFKKLPEIQPKLVFLDFNLSEKYTGYELTSKIKAIVPGANVLLLLGTFDTVDDAAMEKCGASDKVVKPFDSNKFISICRRLTEDTGPIEEIKFPDPVLPKEEPAPESDEDQWQVSHSVETEEIQVKPQPEPDFDIKKHLNPLDQEVSDWGMNIPGIIGGEEASQAELPPVIGEVRSLESHRKASETSAVPSDEDLDYPTVEELTQSKAEDSKSTSKLLSIDAFNNSFEIEHEINSVEQTDVSKLQELIADEVEEDLWKVDEFEELKKEVSSKMEEVKNNFQPTISDFDESLFKPLDETESIQWNVNEPKAEPEHKPTAETSSAPSISASEMRAEMEEMVKKYVKEYMDDMFKQNVEKIAWDVIPDLAENLIRQELTKISKKILEDSNNS